MRKQRRPQPLPRSHAAAAEILAAKGVADVTTWRVMDLRRDGVPVGYLDGTAPDGCRILRQFDWRTRP